MNLHPLSGGSRIFERGVQVQADYGNSTDYFIMAGKYVYADWHPSARSAENFRNLGPLRSHLLAFQAPYSEHWSGSRRNCRICSTAPVAGVNPQTHGLHFEKEVLVGRLPTYIMMILGLYRS